LASRLARIQKTKNVGMLEASSGSDLPEEALRPKGGGEFLMEQLEGYWAVMLEVLGEIDGGHATPAKLALKSVAAR
jgi:hypothetical protein